MSHRVYAGLNVGQGSAGRLSSSPVSARRSNSTSSRGTLRYAQNGQLCIPSSFKIFTASDICPFSIDDLHIRQRDFPDLTADISGPVSRGIIISLDVRDIENLIITFQWPEESNTRQLAQSLPDV